MTASMYSFEDTINHPGGHDCLKHELLKWGQWLQDVFLAYGAIGLVGLAFIDSGLLPLPEAIDLLVVTMTMKHHYRLLEYSLAATAGSVAGCAFLYYIAAKGGHALLERRLGKERSDRIRKRLEKYEVATLLVASVLPPPMPFKAFVLGAGAMEMNVKKFFLAVAAGRMLRYTVEGYLAIRYGAKVLKWITGS